MLNFVVCLVDCVWCCVFVEFVVWAGDVVWWLIMCACWGGRVLVFCYLEFGLWCGWFGLYGLIVFWGLTWVAICIMDLLGCVNSVVFLSFFLFYVEIIGLFLGCHVLVYCGWVWFRILLIYDAVICCRWVGCC